jgi:hypothetical protein
VEINLTKAVANELVGTPSAEDVDALATLPRLTTLTVATGEQNPSQDWSRAVRESRPEVRLVLSDSTSTSPLA